MRGQGSLKIGIENLYTIEPLTENQKLFFKEWKKFPIYVLSGFAGTGKAQPLNCKVKVPGGWINMGDIKPGDNVSFFYIRNKSIKIAYKRIINVKFSISRKTESNLYKHKHAREKNLTIHKKYSSI